MLSSKKHPAADRLRFFSDGKIFTVNAKVNRRNDRWIVSNPKDVPIIGCTRLPMSLHVFMAVSSKGDVMAAHLFRKGETVTKEVYLKLLRTVVVLWIKAVASGRLYIFQQDGAPPHTSPLAQNWLEDNVDAFWSKNFWPPSSPDLDPLDYYVWEVLELDTNERAHNTIGSLRAAVEEIVANMSRAHV